MSNFYNTSFKDSFKNPEVKPFAPYAGATANQFYQISKENQADISKIEKGAWFNSTKKRDFCLNDTKNQIINTFKNVNFKILIDYKLFFREMCLLQSL